MDSPTDPTVFDGASAEKITTAVKRVLEEYPTPRNGPPAKRQHARTSFWARITGSAEISGSSGPFKYSWVEIRRTQNGWEDVPNGRTGDDTIVPAGSQMATWAINPGEQTGSNVPNNTPALSVGTVIRLVFDQGSKGLPYYTMIVGGGGIPAPTERYQVYTPIDDSLVPVWTDARFGS